MISWVRIIMARVPPTPNRTMTRIRYCVPTTLWSVQNLRYRDFPWPTPAAYNSSSWDWSCPSIQRIGALNVPIPTLNPTTQPTMVQVTTMSEPQFDPWSRACDTSQATKPSRIPNPRPVQMLWCR